MNTNIITHMVAEARPDTNREIRTYDACNRRRACCCEMALKIWSLEHMSFIPRLQIVSPLHLATNQNWWEYSTDSPRTHFTRPHTLLQCGPGSVSYIIASFGSNSRAQESFIYIVCVCVYICVCLTFRLPTLCHWEKSMPGCRTKRNPPLTPPR